jgi:hypothetical protein
MQASNIEKQTNTFQIIFLSGIQIYLQIHLMLFPLIYTLAFLHYPKYFKYEIIQTNVMDRTLGTF